MKLDNIELMVDEHNVTYYLEAEGNSLKELVETAVIAEIDDEDEWLYPLREARTFVYEFALDVLKALYHKELLKL